MMPSHVLVLLGFYRLEIVQRFFEVISEPFLLCSSVLVTCLSTLVYVSDHETPEDRAAAA